MDDEGNDPDLIFFNDHSALLHYWRIFMRL